MKPPKEAIITFKVDAALAKAMKGVGNRSEFIRSAVLAALDSSLPALQRERRSDSESDAALAGVRRQSRF